MAVRLYSDFQGQIQWAGDPHKFSAVEYYIIEIRSHGWMARIDSVITNS